VFSGIVLDGSKAVKDYKTYLENKLLMVQKSGEKTNWDVKNPG